MIQFLTNGDFNFPFHFFTYWAKHFYMWSYQTGTPNPDGVIRLPGRILNFLVFGAFGHVAVGYFYLFSSLIIAFLAFFFFTRKFLEIKRLSVQLIGALFFAINPIFLGNLAKVGLVLAAAMLPLGLVFIKLAFTQRKVRYLLLYVACMNVSFLHPYTFTVNAAISGCYLLWMIWQHREWVLSKWVSFAICAVLALGMQAYFVLPIKSMGTVSKDAISDNVMPTHADYTALVSVSNTGDVFTGLSLSKNIFLDFDFYNAAYRNFYFLGTFAFYIILIGLYLRLEKRLKITDRQRLALLFGLFLVFVALATTTFLHLDAFIKFLISLPGGWAFRSPLKWQLYIPLALYGILVILLQRVPGKRQLILLQTGLLATFLLMNAYISLDVYRRILTPRTLQTFSALNNQNLTYKTLLFVNNGDCMQYMRTHPRVTAELAQVFVSKDLQVKRVTSDNITHINAGSYDLVLTCKERTALAPMLVNSYDFRPAGRFAGSTFQLYANQAPPAHIFTPDAVFAMDAAERIEDKSNFTNSVLDKSFNFTEGTTNAYSTPLHDVFEGITPRNITNDGKIVNTVSGSGSPQKLYIRDGQKPLFYSMNANAVRFSANPKSGGQAVAKSITLPAANQYTISYDDKAFDYRNMVKNPSLEEGLWRKKVSDCYQYDNMPSIGMKLLQQGAYSGHNALQLSAKRHIACTGPDAVQVKPGEHYLLHFNYQSPGKRYAGYSITFDDKRKTFLNERMPGVGDQWQSFSRDIIAPKGAHRMQVMVYAYPDGMDAEKSTAVSYDDIAVTRIPPIQDRFYTVGTPARDAAAPRETKFTVIDPTKKVAHIRGAKSPFYLATTESYHPLWRLRLGQTSWPLQNGKNAGASHFKLNNTMNGWVVDPARLCAHSNACAKQPDGSYDLDLTIEFGAQRWLYTGLVISSAAFVGSIAFFAYDWRQSRQDTAERRRR